MTFTAALAGQAPPSNVIAVNFGAKTLKGLGEAPLSYAGGGSVTITAGNTGSIWAINSRNNLVAAGTFGAAAPAYSGPYSLTVTDGVSFTKTVNVTIIANAHHVAWVASGTNADNPAGTTQILTVLQGATIAGGDTVFCRDGSYNPTNARMGMGRSTQFSGASAGNMVTVRSENPGCVNQGGLANDPRGIPWTHGGQAIFGYFELNGNQGAPAAQFIKFQYISFNNPMNGAQAFCLSAVGAITHVSFDNCFVWSFQNQAQSLVQFTGSITGTTLTVTSIQGGSFVAAQGIWSGSFGVNEFQPLILAFGTGGTTGTGSTGTYALSGAPVSGNKTSQRMNGGCWTNGQIPAGGLNATTGGSDWSVTNCEFMGLDDACGLFGANTIYNNNVAHQISQDCVDFEEWSNVTMNWNFFYDKTYDPFNQLHGDFFQAFNSSLSGAQTGFTAIGNIAVRGVGSDGLIDGQGFFMSTTPATTSGTLLAGNIVVGSEANCFTLQDDTNGIVKFNSGIQAQAVNQIGAAAQNVQLDTTTNTSVLYNALSGVISGSSSSGGTTGTVVSVNPATAYTNPTATPSTLNTVAGVLAAFSAKAGGPLDPAISGAAFWAGADHYVDYVNRTTSFPI